MHQACIFWGILIFMPNIYLTIKPNPLKWEKKWFTWCLLYHTNIDITSSILLFCLFGKRPFVEPNAFSPFNSALLNPIIYQCFSAWCENVNLTIRTRWNLTSNNCIVTLRLVLSIHLKVARLGSQLRCSCTHPVCVGWHSVLPEDLYKVILIHDKSE